MTPRVTAITNSRIASSADSWIFSAPTRSGHMEGSSVRKQQTRVFSVTGIKPFELYCLRHTCLTRWAPKMDPLHAGLSCWPQRHFDYEALCSPRRRDHQSRNGESRLQEVESHQYSPLKGFAELRGFKLPPLTFRTVDECSVPPILRSM